MRAILAANRLAEKIDSLKFKFHNFIRNHHFKIEAAFKIITDPFGEVELVNRHTFKEWTVPK